MSTVKLLVIIMLVLTCFIISLGGQPSGQRLGFSYWSDPGAFGSYLSTGTTGRFLGFWACIVQACFAYTGTEVVGVAFGEAPNPKRTVRRAVRQTLWRIVFFYIVGVLVLGMSVPYTNDRLIGATKSSTSAAASPFVIAVQLAKINVFPDVINACLLVFVISAANSDIYIGSRTLYGLALDKQAPAVFRYTNAKGVPLTGIAMTSLFTVLAYMNVTKSSSTVFKYFVSLVTVFGTLNWINVLLSYIQFTRGMKAQGIGRETMPYRGPLQPYGAYCALAITILITFFNGKKFLALIFLPQSFGFWCTFSKYLWLTEGN
jgi:amino acid transporter